MHAHAPKGKRTRSPAAGTRCPEGPPDNRTPVQPREPRSYAEGMAAYLARTATAQAPPSPLDALREKLATLDALADCAGRHAEDGASENQVTRGRHEHRGTDVPLLLLVEILHGSTFRTRGAGGSGGMGVKSASIPNSVIA